jgi:diguanylate cyclase (GGDEF)-like protein
MSRLRYTGRLSVSRLLFRALLAGAWLLVSVGAHASCLHGPDAPANALDELASQNPAKALTQTQAALDALRNARRADPARLAALYSVQASSYSLLELDAEARQAASNGLALARDPTDPVHLQLLMTYAENVYDDVGLAAAIETIAKARAAQPAGSLADICLLITYGRLHHRQDHADKAIFSLTQAYQESSAPERAEQRVLAAAVLSPVMRIMGDYTQALALNQEVVDWHTAHRNTISLSVALFLRGTTLMAMGDNARAIDAFLQARRLSVQIGDQQGIAFADLNTCESQIKLGQHARATPQCTSALQVFEASQSVDMVKQTRAALANIELLEGRPDKARAILNEVLDRGGSDMGARRVASVYELRSRANAALGDYRDAYKDLDEYVRRYVTSNDAERSRQAAALRARFETDRQIERNASLKRELTLAEERSQRQKELLRWNKIAIFAGTLVIALLSYILIASLRHKRQLEKLATQDGLTGLPNRRYTGELASAALEAALAEHRLLTIAVIDLDHFKIINDRCGHAGGDIVLKEFARIGRECVRSSDLFGRWGGEEFLLVMPDTTLDIALVVLERLRSRAMDIELPASSAGMRVTLSAGLATTEENVRSLDDIVARADSALYKAKNQGRDLVRIADESYRTASTGVRRAVS